MRFSDSFATAPSLCATCLFNGGSLLYTSQVCTGPSMNGQRFPMREVRVLIPTANGRYYTLTPKPNSHTSRPSRIPKHHGQASCSRLTPNPHSQASCPLFKPNPHAQTSHPSLFADNKMLLFTQTLIPCIRFL